MNFLCLYIINRENAPIKTTTSSAVEELSSKIPFLRMSNEKRRQVFVESKHDVKYYESLVNIILKKEVLQVEPIFLPARSSDGSNCEDVKNLVKGLYENGNLDIYGIIDWDTHNVSEGRIIVLGEGQRYAIENYILDPLLMGLLFLREKKLTTRYFGVASFSTYIEINGMTQDDAQLIVDKVLADLCLQSPNKVPYNTCNGWILFLTSEFCNLQGHTLEELYKNKYPFLKCYTKEDALKMDVIVKVIEEYYQFMPRDILYTIKSIA